MHQDYNNLIERRLNGNRRLDERVAVLETQMNNHAVKLEENQETLIKIVDRMDTHIQMASERDNRMEQTLVRVTTVGDNLTSQISRTNDTIEVFSTKMASTSDKVLMWDAIARTLIKVATVGSILIGAGWAVYTFAVDHPRVINYETNHKSLSNLTK